jgi:protein TonB
VNKANSMERRSRWLALALSGLIYGIALGLMYEAAQRAASSAPSRSLGSPTLRIQPPPAPPSAPLPASPPAAPEPPVEAPSEQPPEQPVAEPQEPPPPEEVYPAPAPDASPLSAAPSAAASAAASGAEPTVSGAPVDTLEAAAARVRALVDHEKTYPESARRNGITGWCRVRIHVAAGGTITGHVIEERHCSPLLVRAVESTLRRLHGRSAGTDYPEAFDLLLPVEFELQR